MRLTGLLSGGLSVLLILAAGCVQKPTRMGESESRGFSAVVDGADRPVEVTEQTVVLDARPAFQYGLNRVANSLSFEWAGLSENVKTGEPMRDLRKAGLRLALLGITPQTPVVVVGDGPVAGGGEEGRLAWALLYFGVRDVQVTSMESLRKLWTQTPSPPAKNSAPWVASTRGEMILPRSEYQVLAADARGRRESQIWILDIRSAKEYFAQTSVDIGAIQIEWREFYNAKGRPDVMMRKKLRQLGIDQEHRVIVQGDNGVRAAAAAYALIALGFKNVQVFAETWPAATGR